MLFDKCLAAEVLVVVSLSVCLYSHADTNYRAMPIDKRSLTGQVLLVAFLLPTVELIKLG